MTENEMIKWYVDSYPASSLDPEVFVASLSRDGRHFSSGLSTKKPSGRMDNPGKLGGLTESERAKLRPSSFAMPDKKSWPIHDQRHAILAITYMERGFGSAEDYPTIEHEIAKRYAHDPKVMKALQYYRKHFK